MPEQALPVIAVLATGGTIAGAQADATSAGYKAGSFSVGDLLAAVPQLAGLAEIRAEQVANVGSQNMTHDVWRALAQRVEALCADPSVAGIVITHGPRTLEETPYSLSPWCWWARCGRPPRWAPKVRRTCTTRWRWRAIPTRAAAGRWSS